MFAAHSRMAFSAGRVPPGVVVCGIRQDAPLATTRGLAGAEAAMFSLWTLPGGIANLDFFLPYLKILA